jgi:hypothetical protein
MSTVLRVLQWPLVAGNSLDAVLSTVSTEKPDVMCFQGIHLLDHPLHDAIGMDRYDYREYENQLIAWKTPRLMLHANQRDVSLLRHQTGLFVTLADELAHKKIVIGTAALESMQTTQGEAIRNEQCRIMALKMLTFANGTFSLLTLDANAWNCTTQATGIPYAYNTVRRYMKSASHEVYGYELRGKASETIFYRGEQYIPTHCEQFLGATIVDWNPQRIE